MCSVKIRHEICIKNNDNFNLLIDKFNVCIIDHYFIYIDYLEHDWLININLNNLIT